MYSYDIWYILYHVTYYFNYEIHALCLCLFSLFISLTIVCPESYLPEKLFSSGQLRLLTDWVLWGTWWTIQQRSSSSHFCRMPSWTVLAWVRCPLFYVVHPAFSLPTTASPTFQGTLKDGFKEAVYVEWHARTMRFSVSGQLPEKISCGPKRKLILLRF